MSGPLDIVADTLGISDAKVLDEAGLKAVGEIMEGYARITGVAFGIRLPGDPMPIARFGDRRLCSQFHLKIPVSAEACLRQHAELAKRVEENKGMVLTQCEFGLWGGGTPLVVDGVHVATLLMGQVFMEPQDEEELVKRALAIGVDPEAYVAAAREVPVVSRERIEACIHHLSLTAALIASLAHERRVAMKANHGLSRAVERSRMLEQELLRAKEHLEEEVERKTLELRREARRAKKAQERLEEQVHFLNTVLDAIPLPVAVKGEDGRYLECNSAFCDLKGMPKDQLIGRTVMETAPRETGELCSTMDREVFEKGRVVSYHVDSEVAGGRKVHVQIHKAPFYDRMGRISGVVMTIIDLTELKEKEEQLQSAKLLMEKVFDSIDIAILIADVKQHTILACNPAAEKIFGYSEEELYGQPVWIIQKDMDDFTDFAMQAREALKRGESFRAIQEMRRKDGSLVECVHTASFITDEEGEPYAVVCLIQDISELKRSEEERERMQKQLQEAQKMRAIGQLAGGVAHDFNNILTVIQGNAEIASMFLEEDHPIHQRIEEIKEAAERASSLTRQLLAFSRRQPMAKVDVDLNELVENMLKMLRRLVEENTRIELQLAQDLPLVEGDVGQLEQVIMNLVVNARDAMPDGGTITISTGTAEEDGKPMVRISVADEGCGMDQETKERLFEPFFTTKGIGGGTGLGLSVVHGIVEQHGGHIRVESEPGQGSRFDCYLPAKPGSIVPEKGQEAAQDLSLVQSLGSKRVLLVEDDEDVLTMGREMFSRLGLSVTTAEDVAQAKALLQQERFDLVFTDLVLPDGYGIEVADLAPKLHPSIRVVITTGYSNKVEHLEMIARKGIPLIQKPFTMRELSEVVGAVLGR